MLPDTAQAHKSIRTVGRDEHGKKEFDYTTGDDLFRLTGEWDELERHKDWKNDRYYEHIEDSEGT